MSETTAIPQMNLGKEVMLNKAKDIAEKKGQERRENFSRNITGFFSKVKDGFNTALNVMFGAPEALAYVGNETLTAADTTINHVMDSAENTLNRWGNRVDEGLNRFEQRQKAAFNKADENLNRLADFAVGLGLNVAASVESKIANAIFGLPIWVEETRSSIAENNKKRQEARLTAAEAKNQAKINRETKKYQEKMDRLEKHHQLQKTNIEASRDAAATKSQELKNSARVKREQSLRWGIVRKVIAAL